MTSCKLIFKNVHKNLRDYLIYFLTLMISVSLFYAFNSISDQPAFRMGMTRLCCTTSSDFSLFPCNRIVLHF